ncbi:hypothetical protein GQ53DRAFT_336317 [Thozetella sp. PMI_491]|nr:hypothetical protein GQ53DRAFT_336317 [Thozetella sp. PMI_491]
MLPLALFPFLYAGAEGAGFERNCYRANVSISLPPLRGLGAKCIEGWGSSARPVREERGPTPSLSSSPPLSLRVPAGRGGCGGGSTAYQHASRCEVHVHQHQRGKGAMRQTRFSSRIGQRGILRTVVGDIRKTRPTARRLSMQVEIACQPTQPTSPQAATAEGRRRLAHFAYLGR